LLQDGRSKFPEAILNLYEEHVGTERTAAVEARGIQNPFARADREETSSCCSLVILGGLYCLGTGANVSPPRRRGHDIRAKPAVAGARLRAGGLQSNRRSFRKRRN
jgi:hypothetical protein